MSKSHMDAPRPIDPRVEIGHVHLKVADLDRALAFYCDVLGFNLIQRMGSEAAFISAGGYHHHIGLNTWESHGGTPPPPGTTGLYHVAIRYPDRPALADAYRRLTGANIRLDGAADHGVSEALYLKDPDANGIELYYDHPRDDWPRTASGAPAMYTRHLDLDALMRVATAAKQEKVEDGTTPAESSALTSRDWELRTAVFQHFVDTTRAPTVAELAKQSSLSELEVAASLRRLGDHHQLALTPAADAIWMVHPFSAVPTEYPVETSRGQYWANCAWDMLGIPTVLGLDSRTTTRCAETGTAVELGVRDGQLTNSDGFVHFTVRPPDFWENVGYT